MVSARVNLDHYFDPNEKRIRVAFVKFCGMATGGTEKVLQTIASNLDKNKSVSYTHLTLPTIYSV